MSGATQTLVKASYYRSQLYTAYLGVNPLVAAAHPIFSLVERMNLSRMLAFKANLHDLIEHELKAFEIRARDANYDAESIMIGRYLLAAVIQEGLSQHDLNIKRLSHTEKNQKHDARFFQIIERIITKPDIYLDLLELAYLCLSTGYKGSLAKDSSKLESIKESLFATISQHRKFEEKNTDNEAPPSSVTPQETRTDKKWLKLSSLSLSIALLIFIAGNSLINFSAKRFLVESPSTEWQEHYG